MAKIGVSVGFPPINGVVVWWGLPIGLRLSLVRCIKKEHDRTCNMFPLAVGQDKGTPTLKRNAAMYCLENSQLSSPHVPPFQHPPFCISRNTTVILFSDACCSHRPPPPTSR